MMEGIAMERTVVTSFTDRLASEAAARYHDRHPFHVRMHDGSLSREELRLWVANRWYYQTRIPVKDAIISWARLKVNLPRFTCTTPSVPKNSTPKPSECSTVTPFA